MTDEELLAAGRGLGDPALEASVLDAGPAPAPEAVVPSSPVAPNPAAAFDQTPPEFGPPAPGPTDAIAAGLPPVPPGIPTSDPDKQWPPPVPSGAPGMVQPGQPAPAAQTGLPGALADAKTAREAANAADMESYNAGLASRDAASAASDEKATLAADRLSDEEKIKAQYDKADGIAAQEIAKTKEALAGFKFRDLWAGKSTVQKIGSALSTALLAIGAGMMKTPKFAIEILDKEMDDDHKKQVEHLNQLNDQAVMARTGLQDSRAARAKALSDIQLGYAQKDRVVAAQFTAAADRAKSAAGAADANAYAAKLTQRAADSEVTAQKILSEYQLKADAEKARTNELNAQAEMERAHAAGTGGFVPKHKGGGGGGPGSSKVQHAAVELSKMIESRKAEGTPMAFAEMQDFAVKNGIPLNAKGGQTSLASVIADSSKLAKAGYAENSNELKGAGAVNDFVKTRLGGDKELAADLKEGQEVSKALALAKPGPDGNVSGVNFQQAIDATVKAATGLGARPQSIAVFQGSLGGVWDKVMRAIQHGETGQYTAHDVQVLNDALKKQKAYVDGNLHEKEAAYREEFGSHPTTKGHEDAWGSELKARFGHGGGDAKPTAAPIGTVRPGPDGRPRKKTEKGWELVTP